MAGKKEKVTMYAVNKAQNITFKDGQRVKSISITCADISQNQLLIGWNREASTQDYLNPGEGYVVTPDVGNYLDGNELKMKFGNIGSTNVNNLNPGLNQALVRVTVECE
jgi:hypothetical protein